MPITEEVAVLQQSPGGPLYPHIHLGRLQDQNLASGKLEPGKQNKMWHKPCKSLTNSVHPPLSKMIKYSFCRCWRNVLCTSGMRRNNRVKATSSSGRSRVRALGSRCTWREGGKKMLWLWQLLFSICTICSQGRACDRPLLEHGAQQHTSMSAEWFSDSPLPFPLYRHSHLCK